MSDEHSFFAGVEATHEANIKKFSDTLNIAVVGNVSSGKSSLINALLRRDRNTMIATVGAEAGTTIRLQSIKLDDHVRIVDSPGLLDIRRENSEITREFLKFVDIGILVITGAADSVQRAHLQDLHQACARTFVVLSKIDQWDKHKPEALAKVESQWKTALGIGTLYKACCFGYDPDTDPDSPLDLRGVDDLRKDIETFLAYKGKDMLLSRHLYNKEHSATKIIAGALVAVAIGALVPGAALIVAVAQVSALYSIYYLYTGKLLPKAAIGSILLTLGGQAAASQIFLVIKSILPPTGIADIGAAYVAVLYTFALLGAFTKLLARGAADITGDELLKEFKSIRGNLKHMISESSAAEWRSQDFWSRLIKTMLF